MHSGEVAIDELLVRQLVRTQLPRWQELSVRSVEPRGTDNALFRLGPDLVVRLPRIAHAAERLEKELVWLPRLAGRLYAETPRVCATGLPGCGYPFRWSVSSWLEGRPADGSNSGFALDLARFIESLQAVDSSDGPPPGQHNAFRGVSLERRDRMTRASIEALGDRVDANRLTAVWERAVATPAWDRAPVWIHGDLDSRNVLVDEDGRLAGVIDFGCLGVGDPACDVMAAWKLFAGPSRDAFRDALSVDDATWERARGWVVSQAVVALSYYTLETNAVLVREAERWLAEATASCASGS